MSHVYVKSTTFSLTRKIVNRTNEKFMNSLTSKITQILGHVKTVKINNQRSGKKLFSCTQKP